MRLEPRPTAINGSDIPSSQALREPAPCYGEAMSRALVYAAEAFRQKTRKSTDIPYLTHLLAVAAIVGEHGGTEEQMIAALLHDVLEDVEDATREDLAARFGEPVTRMVEALSDATGHPKPAWMERKTRYLAHLAHEDPAVKLVSAADKFHNLTSLLKDLKHHGESVWDRFNAGREDQIWYYKRVVEALGTGWETPLLAELREQVASLEQGFSAR